MTNFSDDIFSEPETWLHVDDSPPGFGSTVLWRQQHRLIGGRHLDVHRRLQRPEKGARIISLEAAANAQAPEPRISDDDLACEMTVIFRDCLVKGIVDEQDIPFAPGQGRGELLFRDESDQRPVRRQDQGVRSAMIISSFPRPRRSTDA
jgi:hypothetical protein